MSSLVVVVVNEDEGIHCVQLIPRLAKVSQVGQLLSAILSHNIAEVLTMTELSNATDVRVLSIFDAFISTDVNNLQHNSLK